MFSDDTFALHELDDSPCESDDEAEKSCHGGDNPKAHGDFGFFPAAGFEVVVDWRGDEDFAVEEFFAEDLDETAAGFYYEDDAD